MRINTNLTAMNTFTQYTKNNNKIANSVAKLSSGFAINSAADNAAGLAISEKMRAQIRGLSQASTNAQDAISLTQTAEGSLGASTEILQRMRELAVQSANDTNENAIDREALQDEFSQLQEELNNIAKTTTFNKKNLLDGSLSKKQAATSNLSLASSGLSVSLGKVAAGNYSFEAVVKAESAAVAAATAKFTGTSLDSKVTAGAITVSTGGTLENTSLANGNYDIEASWNADTKEMSLTAKGDNGQTFTATLTKDELDAYAADTSTPLTLKFGNGNSEAFQMTLDTKTTFSTSNDSTMETVAKELSDALTLSATGGVDAKDATYALYATMTGAEDVKLSAGMNSVTFSNGVTVSFDQLTVSDVTVSADDYAEQNNTGTKAVYSFDLSKSTAETHFSGKNIDGVNMTWTENTDKTMAKFVEDYNNASGKSYTAAYDADTDKLTLTQKEPATVGAAPASTVEGVKYGKFDTGVTLSSGDKKTVTVSSDAASDFNWTNSTATTDLSALIGKKVTMSIADGKTYTVEILANGADTAGKAANTYVTLGTSNQGAATALATSIKTALQAQLTADNATAAAGTQTYIEHTALDFTAGTNNSFTSVSTTQKKFTYDPTAANGTAALTATEEAAGEAPITGAGAPDGQATYGQVFGGAPSTFSVNVADGAGLTFQIGANKGDELVINVDRMDAEYLGVASADVLSRENASNALSAVDKALNEVASQRAYLGAIQNRLDHKIANLDTSNENLTAAESQIRDVDMAKEMTKFTNANILSQAATAMLAQANSLPQNVLSLIG
ncbi:MAG: hypothetical protein E7472_00715 [Ruminococcaceae bacterium]|nr:hypothetical protein [Oscillospiraceae bacterium]